MQTLKLDIRPARVEDARPIAQVLRAEGFRYLSAQSEEETSESVGQRLEHALKDGAHSVFVAALGDSALLGFVVVSWARNLRFGLDGYVLELFVLEEARSKGIGTALLEAVKREARARDCSRLVLWLRRDSRTYAQGFFPEAGWRERDDVVLFNLHLDPLPE